MFTNSIERIGLIVTCVLGVMGTSLLGWTLFASAAPQAPGVEIGPNHTRQANTGQSITYNHILTNTGTTTDTFLLEFLSAQHWPTELLGGPYPTGTLVLPLQVGSQLTASFQVSLTVPSGVASITETTIITATSQTSPTVYDTAIDTTIVGPSLVYLPLVIRMIPPDPPVLEPIDITPIDGNYHIVSWSTSARATSYTLERDTNPGFGNPQTVYDKGSNTTWSSPNGGWGTICGDTFYYRVQASGPTGVSKWSNTQSVTTKIDFTDVPDYGTFDNLHGKVCNVNPADYKVAVYIYVPGAGGWWTKPTFAYPLTSIRSNGTWTCDITTGGIDHLATQIAAFLVPNGYYPPRRDGHSSLPGALLEYPHVLAIRSSTSRVITFSGYEWEVKSSEWPVGPGPNYFSDRNEDVWIDENGWLHMRIVPRSGLWYCTEVITTQSFGYGMYTFTLASRVDQLDKNVVLGLFTWDDAAPEHNYREIDIEFSRWGEETGDNSQFVVQPWGHTGNRHRFNMNLRGDHSTHSFDWSLNNIQFSSFHGHVSPPDPNDEIESWLYAGTDIPPEGDENARINLWLLDSNPPSDGEAVEAVIEAFEFIPQTG
jgi:hypothetical protein